MTEEHLREIEERASKATPGPWLYDERVRCAAIYQAIEPVNCFDDVDEFVVFEAQAHGKQERADFTFISRAREDVPRLLAEVERLRAEVCEVRQLLWEAEMQIRSHDEYSHE